MIGVHSKLILEADSGVTVWFATAYAGIEPHTNPGFHIRYADNIVLNNCSVKWGNNLPHYFTHALEAHHATGVKLHNFKGTAAHPKRNEAVVISSTAS